MQNDLIDILRTPLSTPLSKIKIAIKMTFHAQLENDGHRLLRNTLIFESNFRFLVQT